MSSLIAIFFAVSTLVALDQLVVSTSSPITVFVAVNRNGVFCIWVTHPTSWASDMLFMLPTKEAPAINGTNALLVTRRSLFGRTLGYVLEVNGASYEMRKV